MYWRCSGQKCSCYMWGDGLVPSWDLRIVLLEQSVSCFKSIKLISMYNWVLNLLGGCLVLRTPLSGFGARRLSMVFLELYMLQESLFSSYPAQSYIFDELCFFIKRRCFSFKFFVWSYTFEASITQAFSCSYSLIWYRSTWNDLYCTIAIRLILVRRWDFPRMLRQALAENLMLFVIIGSLVL